MDKEMGPPRHTYGQIYELEEQAGLSQSYVHLFEHIAANCRLFTVMMGSDGDPWFASHMREHLSAIAEQRILAREKQRLASPKDLAKGMPRKVAVGILTSAFVSAISWWLEDGMKYSPAQMAGWVQHIIMKGFLGGSGRGR